MTTYDSTVLTYVEGKQNVTLTKISTSAPQAFVCNCDEMALLLIDALQAGVTLTVTVHAGDGPAAAGDLAFELEQQTFTAIPVDTAAYARADGKIYFTVSAESTLATTNTRIGVLLQRNVTAY